jgi:two-component system osmolarity sensor histidine kinase EnvZ
MNRKISILGILVAGGLLLGFISFALMERHWNQVGRRLSEGMARDMAAIVDLYEASSTKEDVARLIHIGLSRFGLSVVVLPAGALPTPEPKPFFDLLDRALSDEIRANVKRPFWIDTVGQSRQVEVRIKLDQAILRFVAPRRQAFVSNSHIFLTWMLGTSVILLAVACLFLRPIVRAAAP